MDRVVFPGVDFTDKQVLDVGGGSGLCSFYAALLGAKKVTCLEPMLEGSDNVSLDFSRFADVCGIDNAQILNDTLQGYLGSVETKFDLVIMHDSINHLDEGSYSKLHKDEEGYAYYVSLMKRLYEQMAPGGMLIVTDCSRRNFFGDLGRRSPFAPSIEWHLHQPPSLVVKFLMDSGFTFVRYRWTPLKRLGLIGLGISKLGRLPAYFMQSHFVLLAEKYKAKPTR